MYSNRVDNRRRVSWILQKTPDHARFVAKTRTGLEGARFGRRADK
jgi:hypothetical protein